MLSVTTPDRFTETESDGKLKILQWSPEQEVRVKKCKRKKMEKKGLAMQDVEVFILKVRAHPLSVLSRGQVNCDLCLSRKKKLSFKSINYRQWHQSVQISKIINKGFFGVNVLLNRKHDYHSINQFIKK